MSDNLQKDVSLTHSITNYLSAQFRGQLAFLKALTQLSHSVSLQNDIKTIERDLSYINRWNKELTSGMPIFSVSWKVAETGEAQQAFVLLKKIKSEIKNLSTKLDTIIQKDRPFEMLEDLKFSIACNVRYAYTRENFIKGFMEFAASLSLEELHNRYKSELQQAGQDIQKATALFKELKQQGRPEADKLSELEQTLKVIAAITRSYMHDINFMLAIYAPSFTFENAEFSETEASAWQNLNFTANEAGYWRAYTFDAEKAVEWFNVGIQDPCSAFVWQLNGFEPLSAIAWWNLGIDAKSAKELSKKGETPDAVYAKMQKAASKSAA